MNQISHVSPPHYASLDVSVGQLVAERPERAALLEKYGIDYCCAGHHRLSEACTLRRVDPKEVLMSLIRSDSAASEKSEKDWTTAPLSELIDHVTEKHHGYLREALPRITYLINKVWDAHVQNHPELSDVASTFATFRSCMERHIAKEEQTLFPLCRSLESSTSAAVGRGLSLADLVMAMEDEHVAIAGALESLRALTDNYAPPINGCPTYRVMLSSLAELEEETRRHVYKEDAILIPRALALSKR